MTKSVLWDLDGTLVDSEQYHWLAWRDAMAAEGVSLTHEQFLKTFGLRNDAIVPQWISDASPERIKNIADAKEQLYRRLVREGGPNLYPARASGPSGWPRKAGFRLSRRPLRAKTSTWCSPSLGSRPVFRP